MLVVSRRKNEVVVVDGPCKVFVMSIHGNFVRIGIEADKKVKIMRAELETKLTEEKPCLDS